MQSKNFIDAIEKTHADWQPILIRALQSMDQNYLQSLLLEQGWLPGIDRIFAAFSYPLAQLKYILVGESPYPRAASANGYAFWDAAVKELWSAKGLSKEVNRATSLRNFIKMLLIAKGVLELETSQEAIANLDKSKYVQTGQALFQGMLDRGFLLLNACLVYSKEGLKQHFKAWQPFVSSVLQELALRKNKPCLLLFGEIAKKLPEIYEFDKLIAEHPYNLSFIRNTAILNFFRPLDLLEPLPDYLR